MYDFQSEISRCINLVRWNPHSAIRDMEMLRIEAGESEMKHRIWTHAANSINKTIKSIETAPYYDKKEYWGQYPSTLLEIF